MGGSDFGCSTDLGTDTEGIIRGNPAQGERPVVK